MGAKLIARWNIFSGSEEYLDLSGEGFTPYLSHAQFFPDSQKASEGVLQVCTPGCTMIDAPERIGPMWN